MCVCVRQLALLPSSFSFLPLLHPFQQQKQQRASSSSPSRPLRLPLPPPPFLPSEAVAKGREWRRPFSSSSSSSSVKLASERSNTGKARQQGKKLEQVGFPTKGGGKGRHGQGLSRAALVQAGERKEGKGKRERERERERERRGRQKTRSPPSLSLSRAGAPAVQAGERKGRKERETHTHTCTKRGLGKGIGGDEGAHPLCA